MDLTLSDFDSLNLLTINVDEMIRFSIVVRYFVRLVHDSLLELMDTATSSEERKKKLFEWAKVNRLLTFKMLALTRWCRNSSVAVICAQSAISALHKIDATFDVRCEQLNVVHVPAFSTPKYHPDYMMVDYKFDVRATLVELNRLILLRLVSLECGIPQQMMNYVVENGHVIFMTDEFDLTLTLPNAPDPASPWYILDLKMLELKLEPYQLCGLVNLGQRRLMNTEGFCCPLMEIYHFYRNLALSLRFEKLILECSVQTEVQANISKNRIQIEYWTHSKFPGVLDIVFSEELVKDTLNCAYHYLIAPPPEPNIKPVFVDLQSEKTEYSCNCTSLMANNNPVGMKSLQDLLLVAYEQHALSILSTIAAGIESAEISGKSLMFSYYQLVIGICLQNGKFTVSSLNVNLFNHPRILNLAASLNAIDNLGLVKILLDKFRDSLEMDILTSFLLADGLVPCIGGFLYGKYMLKINSIVGDTVMCTAQCNQSIEFSGSKSDVGTKFKKYTNIFEFANEMNTLIDAEFHVQCNGSLVISSKGIEYAIVSDIYVIQTKEMRYELELLSAAHCAHVLHFIRFTRGMSRDIKHKSVKLEDIDWVLEDPLNVPIELIQLDYLVSSALVGWPRVDFKLFKKVHGALGVYLRLFRTKKKVIVKSLFQFILVTDKQHKCTITGNDYLIE